jgi:hypothetical protein
LVKQEKNLAEAISKGGKLKPLLELLTSVTGQIDKLRADENAQQDQSPLAAEMSREEIFEALPDILMALIESSVEFATVLRTFFKTFVIQPVQALDTGLVRPRAVLTFEGGGESLALGETATKEVVLDIFDPADHIAAIPEVLKHRGPDSEANLRAGCEDDGDSFDDGEARRAVHQVNGGDRHD